MVMQLSLLLAWLSPTNSERENTVPLEESTFLLAITNRPASYDNLSPARVWLAPWLQRLGRAVGHFFNLWLLNLICTDSMPGQVAFSDSDDPATPIAQWRVQSGQFESRLSRCWMRGRKRSRKRLSTVVQIVLANIHISNSSLSSMFNLFSSHMRTTFSIIDLFDRK